MRKTYKEIQERFASKGHTLLTPEEDYQNTRQKLEYRCGNCSGISYMTANTAIGNRRYCSNCASSKTLTFEYVKEYFRTQGCKLLETTYKNNRTKMKYICSCGNESSITFTHFQSGERCSECRVDRIVSTQRERYGGCGFESPSLKAKTCAVVMERYGVTHYTTHPDFFEKAAKTKSLKPSSPKSTYSKESQRLFWKIYEKLSEEHREHTYFGELNHEYNIYHKGKVFAYDFVVTTLKKCVEYNGSVWHGHPLLEDTETGWHPFQPNLTAREQRDFDEYKINSLRESRSYETLVVWDFDENPVKTIREFLQCKF